MMRASMFDPAAAADPLSELYQSLVRREVCGPGKNLASLAIEHFGTDLPSLGNRLARHLSEYDASGWFCMNEALAELARRDFSSLRLLGFQDVPEVSLKEFYPSVAGLGGMIFEMQSAAEDRFFSSEVFRVAVTPGGKLRLPEFHLAIDSMKFPADCVIAVIGDAFIEWMENRNPTAAP